jgi:hypothetical protein
MRRIHGLVSAFVGLGLAAAAVAKAEAAVAVFTDRTIFEAVIANNAEDLGLESFDGFPPAQNVNLPVLVDPQNRYFATTTAPQLTVIGDGQPGSAWSTGAVLYWGPDLAEITFDFNENVSAFGIDFLVASVVALGAIRVSIPDIGFSTVVPTPNDGGFVGVVVDNLQNPDGRFGEVTVTALGGFAFLDNVIYAYPQVAGGPVPEPRAWALMILGFGAAGAALRRRREVVA